MILTVNTVLTLDDVIYVYIYIHLVYVIWQYRLYSDNNIIRNCIA